jgi:hypothetical protein
MKLTKSESHRSLLNSIWNTTTKPKTVDKKDEIQKDLERCVYEMKPDRQTIEKILKIDYLNSDLQISKYFGEIGTHEFDVFDLR